jgi:hypothetical protein
MSTFPAADMTPQLFAPAITMPNLAIRVRGDAWTKNPEDAQSTFDMLGTKGMEAIWVENTTRRFKVATTTLGDIGRRCSPSSKDI